MVHQDIIKGIWKGLVPHRVEIFAWLSMLAKINTRSRLLQIGIITPENSFCVFCNSSIETPDHLLIHCHLPSMIWTWWLNMWNLSWTQPASLKEAFHQWRPAKGGPFFKKIWAAAFFVIIWTIWKERNARIFSNISSSSRELQDLVLLRLCWWLKAWEDDFPYSADEVIRNPSCLNWEKSVAPRNSSQHLVPHLWSPPPIETLQWNVDASYKSHHDHAAVGGVLRNSMGNFVCLFSSPIPLLEINSAEVFAIFRAIKISINSDRINNHSLIIISDSSNAVQWCNQDSGGPWNLSFMLNFIRNARKQWLSLSIIHKV
ncbi:uncharacterized protein LOC104890179 [Beta vulgaris subsp. vulgaris]|uniref:uncharacterized protein LOC104890179 n=1 Tax=Beta vulgaris subsp. vulgaris TaxID=3555 RepID=UPI00054014A0|nr:uncharacterized protein LOC104890179 [Beta vulgaris subsp. vulgaris]